MKIKVDILLGFLNAGKTTLINLFLQSGELDDEKVVIVQYENGKKSISRSRNVFVINRKIDKQFQKELLYYILSEYMPDRIIIEYSGMGNTDEFINSFNEPHISKICEINRIINIIDGSKTYLYMHNMRYKLDNQIKNSNVIVLNNLPYNQRMKVGKSITNVNKNIKIIGFIDEASERRAVENAMLCLNTDNEKLTRLDIIILLTVFIFLTLIISSMIIIGND